MRPDAFSIVNAQIEINALRDRIDAIEARLPRVGPAIQPDPVGATAPTPQEARSGAAATGTKENLARRREAPTGTKKALATGKIVDLMAIEPADIDFALAADALSKIARFDGNTRGEFAYSVAQHSVLVALNCPPGPERTVGLLHDLHEWLIGDITRPVQALIGDLAGYHKACEAIDRAVAEAAGIAWDDWQSVRAEVKHIDDRVLVTEARLLMDEFDARHWPDADSLYGIFGVTPLCPREAREQFLVRLCYQTGIDLMERPAP